MIVIYYGNKNNPVINAVLPLIMSILRDMNTTFYDVVIEMWDVR